MTLLSYSQNFEDVLLWRALRDVPAGFYIDVGANDPELHSVTKLFYDAGWHGINIEPMPSYLQPFLAQRPRDINLSCAAGAAAGEITLFDVPTMNGWASTDSAVATAHRADGYDVVETAVPLRTLADICAEHVNGEIHFLKIDVEGFEGEVLKGMDFKRWRPWVLVVEATLPGSTETNHGSWEHLITPFDYDFAYFDGLNRYYVAREHADLLPRLAVQANVFDDFIPHHLDKAWRQLGELQAQTTQGWERAAEMERAALDARAQHDQAARHADLLAQQGDLLRQQLRDSETHARQVELALRTAELQGQTLEAQLHQSAAWGQDMESRLLAMLSSTSWRITAPLRFITRRGPNSMAGIAKRKAKGAARRALRWVTSRESLRRTVLPLVMRSPALQAWVARTLAAAKQATANGAAPGRDVPYSLRELPQSARDALDDLRRAFEQNKH